MSSVSDARIKRLAVGALVGVVVGVLVAALAYLRPSFLERNELSAYDQRALSVASSRPSKEIVIVEVAEEDIVYLEQVWGLPWPWPREIWGHLATAAKAGGAKAVAFDFVFHDRGFYSVDDAETFAEAMRETQNVIVGLALKQQPDLPSSSTEESWGLRVRELATRKEAERIAIRLLAWDVKSYLVGEEPTTLYVGGLLSSDAALMMWDRISTAEELSDDLGIVPDDGRTFEPAKLSAEVRSARFSLRSLIAERDGFSSEDLKADFPIYAGMYEPLAVIAAAPRRLGVVSQRRDDDGVMRRHVPLFEHDERLYPSLALASFLVGNPDVVPSASTGELTLGERSFPLDDDGRLVIRFDRTKRYRHVPAFEILRSIVLVEEGSEPSVDPAIFEDAYVIVSAAAVALSDNHPSPVAQLHRGAEIQANVLENLLHGKAIGRVSPLIDALCVLAVSVASALIVMFAWGAVRKARLALVLTFFVVAFFSVGWWLFTTWLLGASSVWIAAVAPVLGIGASSFAAVLTTTASERKSKRFVQEALGRYTSPALVAELTEHPEHLSLEWGEVRQMSVYFSDIAGFTTISEGLEPKKLVALLNEYLTSMTDIILEHDGVVDKYIGDAIMAFWGAPIPDPDHAAKAVKCALAMRNKCAELRPQWLERYGESVFARAGVNSGEAVVGNMGSAHKYNYTVMGDMVNLAARLESANKPYGSELMISEYTLDMLGDEIAVRELDLLVVKGKEQPVRVFEVLETSANLSEELTETCQLFDAGLTHYRNQDFTAASKEFARAIDLGDDGPARLYLERCEHFIEEPPPADWDGVWRMTTK